MEHRDPNGRCSRRHTAWTNSAHNYSTTPGMHGQLCERGWYRLPCIIPARSTSVIFLSFMCMSAQIGTVTQKGIGMWKRNRITLVFPSTREAIETQRALHVKHRIARLSQVPSGLPLHLRVKVLALAPHGTLGGRLIDGDVGWCLVVSASCGGLGVPPIGLCSLCVSISGSSKSTRASR